MDQNGWFRLEGRRNAHGGPPAGRPKAAPKPPGRPKVTSLPVSAEPPAGPEPVLPAPAPEGPLLAPSAPLSPPEPPPSAPPEREPQRNAPAPPPESGPNAAQTVGARGPVLWQDGVLHETLADLFCQTPQPRAIYAKGFGAFGRFTPYASMAEYTALSFLQCPGQVTPVAARFSLAFSGPGAPDTVRDLRGFAVKFFSSDGVFDLLCAHLPVFPVRDALRFPAVARALRPSPVRSRPDPDRFWSFVAEAPESVHFLTWFFSDEGTVRSLRRMGGHSVNAYVWVDRAGRRRFVKYRWVPLDGPACISAAEAVRLAGEAPGAAGQELFETIAAGTPAEYELQVQLMDPQLADSLSYDPLDCTKVWSETDFPPLPVGRLTLDRNPENDEREIEPLAFSPANLLPGAELSADKLLQARANIYWDVQRQRLGSGFRQLSANRQENWTPAQLVTSGSGQELCGRPVRTPTPLGDDFAQAGERFRALPQEQQDHLTANLAAALRPARPDLQQTALGYFREADPELARQVARDMEL